MFVDEGNDDADADDESDDEPMMKSNLPPGRPEHQELTDHTTCLANRSTQKDCNLRELVIHKVERILFPQLDDDAQEHYPDCDQSWRNVKCLRLIVPLVSFGTPWPNK